MVSNPPYQYDADIVAKLKSIGIGPGLSPSTSSSEEETGNANITTTNIKQALQKGIEQGEKLIDGKEI